jgi:phosphate transport system permease protein
MSSSEANQPLDYGTQEGRAVPNNWIDAPNAQQRLSKWSSGIMFGVCTLFAAVILLLLVLVTGYLISIGLSSVSLSIFTREPSGDPAHPGGMLNGLVGTGVLILLASVVGIPIGMLSGVYLAEYDTGAWLAKPVRFIADVLAGVPSIVVGVLGYELIVVPLGTFNAYAGAAALAFIMIPIVCRTTEEMLRLVPNSYREAAIALGATRSRTILRVVLPSATGSVVTGIMLAIARIAGETAPLLFTALSSFYMPRQPSDLGRAFPSLTVQIFNYATGPYPELKRQAWAGILVLITLIFFLNLAIRYATRQRA